ncbi:MAG: molybdopterin-dependent oxidoreductase [Acidobacteriota bacterium]
MKLKRPGFLFGALVGALVTAPLVAVLYAGWKLAGLPFVPFHLFDWTARLLPGRVITFGIDSMVRAIRALHIGDTASAAKAAEQAMAVTVFLVAGIFAGALLFAILKGFRARSSLPGILLGAILGMGAVILLHGLGRETTVPPAVADGWVIASFLAWGAGLGIVYRRLALASEVALDDEFAASVLRVDRRQFLVRVGGATATISVIGAFVGALANDLRPREPAAAGGKRWSSDHPLPNAGADVPPAPGTRPEYTPLEDHYRIDITTVPPVIDGANWRLKVGGLVERPVELTLDRIRQYEPLHQFVTLACISNPLGGSLIGTTRWTGVSFQRLLPDLHLAPTATHLKITSADRFYEVVALDKIRNDPRVMLAYDWDGVPLTTPHGFPLRIYIPDLYGMKQPKWIRSIEALDHSEPGYWVKRGWDETARMKAASVIDTVSVNMMLSQADATSLIPVGGIAHAGARGISRVEVQVDGGPWNEARLRAPMSGTTWVVWRYDWPFRPGNHTFTVRCVDGAGSPQIAEMAPPHPSGASGYHSKGMML